jgi:hypothetical protein
MKLAGVTAITVATTGGQHRIVATTIVAAAEGQHPSGRHYGGGHWKRAANTEKFPLEGSPESQTTGDGGTGRYRHQQPA